jgi:hypothetical protein
MCTSFLKYEEESYIVGEIHVWPCMHKFLKGGYGCVQIDYEIGDGEVWKMTRSTLKDWTHNLETIQSWCPYANEEELFDQVLFSSLS